MKRILLFGILSMVATVASAQQPSLIPESGDLGAGCSFVTGDFGFECIPLYIAYLIQVIFGFVGVICLMQIIFSGYQIAIGSYTGDKEKGKERLIAALLGLAICVGAFLIVDFFVSGLLLAP